MAFTQDRNQIITKAFGKLGVSDPTTAEMEEGSDFLNIEVNSLQTYGLFLWQTNENVYALTASSKVKQDSKSFRAIKDHTSATASKPNNGSDWEYYWKEITFDTTNSAWADTTAYTSINEIALGNTVIDVQSIMVRTTSGFDYPVERIGYEDYSNINDKHQEDRPSRVYIRKDGTLTSGDTTLKMIFYPHFSSVDDLVIAQEIINITESTTNSEALDIIKRFYKLLILATSTALSYKYDPDMTRLLNREYRRELDLQLNGYKESTDINVIDPYIK